MFVNGHEESAKRNTVQTGIPVAAAEQRRKVKNNLVGPSKHNDQTGRGNFSSFPSLPTTPTIPHISWVSRRVYKPHKSSS